MAGRFFTTEPPGKPLFPVGSKQRCEISSNNPFTTFNKHGRLGFGRWDGQWHTFLVLLCIFPQGRLADHNARLRPGTQHSELPALAMTCTPQPCPGRGPHLPSSELRPTLGIFLIGLGTACPQDQGTLMVHGLLDRNISYLVHYFLLHTKSLLKNSRGCEPGNWFHP